MLDEQASRRLLLNLQLRNDVLRCARVDDSVPEDDPFDVGVDLGFRKSCECGARDRTDLFGCHQAIDGLLNGAPHRRYESNVAEVEWLVLLAVPQVELGEQVLHGILANLRLINPEAHTLRN